MEIAVSQGDALDFPCDILVLKHAQALYGVDELVVERLEASGLSVQAELPQPGDFRLFPSSGILGADKVLFFGVSPLRRFDYQEIRAFAERSLGSLANVLPSVEQIAFTLHGPGYGLDESEAFRAEVGGFFDAYRSRQYPQAAKRITVIERNAGRAGRLQKLLAGLREDAVPTRGYSYDRSIEASHPLKLNAATEPEQLLSVGSQSRSKDHIFVAMPFAQEFNDRFHYGIQGAVNSAGCLCERADLSSFTGDVITWVKDRIQSARILIADLSTANPNVYLEVGFAWGVGVPTVLIAEDENCLKFDVRGQRCLIYDRSIQKLERELAKELRGLTFRASP